MLLVSPHQWLLLDMQMITNCWLIFFFNEIPLLVNTSLDCCLLSPDEDLWESALDQVVFAVLTIFLLRLPLPGWERAHLCCCSF